MTSYEITSLPTLSMIQYTDTAESQSAAGAKVGPMFGRLIPAMQQLGLDPAQPTLAWYDDSRPMRFGVGVEVDPGFDAGDSGLEHHELVAQDRAVVTRFRGGVDGIGPAWGALHAHLAEEGLEPSGTCREIYLEGDPDHPDSFVIDLQQPVA